MKIRISTLFLLALVGLTGSALAAPYPGAPDKYEHPRLSHTAGAPGSNSNAGSELSPPALTDQYGAPGSGTSPSLLIDSREKWYWLTESFHGYFFDQRMCVWYENIHASPPVPIFEFHLMLLDGTEIEMAYNPGSDKISLDYDGTSYTLLRQPPVTKASLTTYTDAWTYGAHQFVDGDWRISIGILPTPGLVKVAFTKGADPTTGSHGTLKWMVPFRPDPRSWHTWENLTGDVESGAPAGEVSGVEPEALDLAGLLEDPNGGTELPLRINKIYYQNVASCRPTTAANGAL